MKNMRLKISIILVAIIGIVLALEAITIGFQGVIAIIAIAFILYLTWGKLNEKNSLESK